jgi:hypothetical protein
MPSSLPVPVLQILVELGQAPAGDESPPLLERFAP